MRCYELLKALAINVEDIHDARFKLDKLLSTICEAIDSVVNSRVLGISILEVNHG